MLGRFVMAIVTALCLVWISTAGEVLAQRQGLKGKPPPKDPPNETCSVDGATPSDFTLVATVPLPEIDNFMFGRPIAGGQMDNGTAFAVAARIPNADRGRLFIYGDPATNLTPIADFDIGCTADDPCLMAFRAQTLAAADFNGDDVPDFAVQGIGSTGDAVAIYASTGDTPAYELTDVRNPYLDPVTSPLASNAIDSIAATDDWVVVGAPGFTNRDAAGTVLIYMVNADATLTFVDAIQSPNAVDGDQFGTGVALRVNLDTTVDLIVGAPGVDAGKKVKDQGEVWIFCDLSYSLVNGWEDRDSLKGLGKNDRFGAEVAVAGNQAVAATGWGANARAEFVFPGSVTLEPESGFEGGWASRGITTGALNGGAADDIIIGAPNAPCGENRSAGRAYLYRNGFPTRVIFKPPIAPTDDWTAFGWSSAIIGSFVVIGEPGRDLPAADGANDGQVYVYQYTPPPT